VKSFPVGMCVLVLELKNCCLVFLKEEWLETRMYVGTHTLQPLQLWQAGGMVAVRLEWKCFIAREWS